MKEKLVRLWDKDAHLIASGNSVEDVIGGLWVTVDAEGGRRVERVVSVELVDDSEFLNRWRKLGWGSGE